MSENALTIDGGSAAAPALPAVTGASFGNAKGVDALKARVDKLAEDFPLYPGLDQIH